MYKLEMYHKFSTVHSTQANQQEEDSENQLRIGRAVIKRIKRLLDENFD
jgi:hypothetical protein